MTGDFIEPHDPRWSRLLERVPHDFYQLPQYLELAARYEGGEPVAFYAEDAGTAFLLPLLLREVPAELIAAGTAGGLRDAGSSGSSGSSGSVPPEALFDATSPYGYPGLLAAGPDAEARAGAFLAVFGDRARERRIVTAFLRLHPFLGPRSELLGPGGRALRHGEVVYIDLMRSPEELWGELRASHRTRINRLRRQGFVVCLDEWPSFDAFPALYRSTMSRVAAKEFYYFSDDYFRDLRTALGERLHLHVVRSPEGDLAAAGLFTATGGTVQYHLGATAAEYLRDAPSKLLFHAASSWAREQGYRILNLGGGVGGDADSLFHFKAGFSNLRAEYHTFRMILDRQAYELLQRRWEARYGLGDAPPPDFFPSYRYDIPAEMRTTYHPFGRPGHARSEWKRQVR